MGEPLTDYDWSRRRVVAVMGNAARRCAELALLLASADLGADTDLLRRQAQSVGAMRWAEGVFRAWAEGDAATLQQLGPDDLTHARAILDAAEGAMP